MHLKIIRGGAGVFARATAAECLPRRPKSHIDRYIRVYIFSVLDIINACVFIFMYMYV